MAKQLIILLPIFLLVLFSFVAVSFSNETRIKANVVYLGSVDGKSFFAQMDPPMSWLEANKSCTESGMKLATITSNEQLTLLYQAYNNLTFDGNFWTSGRDALTPTQMVWDLNKDPINKNVNITYIPESGILTCLSFHIFPQTLPHYDADLCIKEYGALCEIHHGK